MPIVFFGFYYWGKRHGVRWGVGWLLGASLFFYAWWNPIFVILPMISIGFNYFWVKQLLVRRTLTRLWIGLGANLILLGFFKYTPFILENIRFIMNIRVPEVDIFLPLAISFFTFQQIAYLVDAYQGKITLDRADLSKTYHEPLGYCTFIIFFPHFIAGPIVHHRVLIPQLFQKSFVQMDLTNIIVGLGIFSVGLAKKTVIADGWMMHSANLLFDATNRGIHLNFIEAWVGVLAYTFQLYFDFSGYSDMAIGLARLFNITFPINFNSPYKAASIIEFWRRWHMTLSAFLKDYLYVPLGGSHSTTYRRYMNLMIVMLLGGLWHGPSWTFMAWGGLHGLYLIINHAWRCLVKEDHWGFLWKFTSRNLTFIAVVFGWVLFRAESFGAASIMFQGLIGSNGFVLPESVLSLSQYFPEISFSDNAFLIGSKSKIIKNIFYAWIIAWFMPNTAQIFERFSPAYNWEPDNQSRFSFFYHFRIHQAYALLLGIILAYCILSIHTQQSEFLYFQF